MSQILVKEQTPGASSVHTIMAKLREIGIRDVQLFYDPDIQPYGMWAVVQIEGRTSSLILPRSYTESGLKPYILWWCKTNDGHFRVPNDQDLRDIVAVVTKGRERFKNDPTGHKLADGLDQQSAEKDRRHRQKQKDMIHSIAKPMKRAIRKELA